MSLSKRPVRRSRRSEEESRQGPGNACRFISDMTRNHPETALQDTNHAPQKNENAEGVPEISRGLSDQRERYPRSTIKPLRTLEGCKNVVFTALGVRPIQGREICLSGFRGCRCAQPPASFLHPFRMPERGSVSRSRSVAKQTWGLGNQLSSIVVHLRSSFSQFSFN